MARRRAQQAEQAPQDQQEPIQQEQDHLAPEPTPHDGAEENVTELYPEQDELGAGNNDAPDGHAVILKLQEELEAAKDQMIRAVAEPTIFADDPSKNAKTQANMRYQALQKTY